VQQAFRARVFKLSPSELTDEDVAHVRVKSDVIDEVAAPVNIHKCFLLFRVGCSDSGCLRKA